VCVCVCVCRRDGTSTELSDVISWSTVRLYGGDKPASPGVMCLEPSRRHRRHDLPSTQRQRSPPFASGPHTHTHTHTQRRYQDLVGRGRATNPTSIRFPKTLLGDL